MTTTLVEQAKKILEIRKRWVSEAEDTVLALYELPLEVTDQLLGDADADFTGNVTASITIFPPYELAHNSPEQLQWVNQTKLLYEQLLNVRWKRNIACRGYSEGLYWSGQASLGGKSLSVTLHNAPKPPGCKLIKTTETREVSVYKAECPEDAIV
jgi:hypothetical protein